ncbi:MAG: CapA family protein [Calditrichia bacterium]|nr:CapA family protein [Calditrichia bacterium]
MNKNSIKIKAVGDIAPGDCGINGIGVLSITNKYGAAFPFNKIRNELSKSDILIGNLEGVLSNQCNHKKLRLCGHPDIAKTLKDIGFDVVSLANNHVFDHGEKVLEETIELLHKAGISICGLRGENGYYCKPVILNRNNMSIGILAYNWIGLENPGKFGDRIAIIEDGVVNYTWHRDKERDKKARIEIKDKNKWVINDIKKLREEVDFIILLPHWGIEWTIYPPYGVTLEAKFFIDAGVDLVIGSHPHVIQGYENYNDRQIFYSLGNFLFDGFGKKSKYGMLIEVDIAPQKVLNYKIHFVRRGKYFQPEPIDSIEYEKNIKLIEKSNKAINADNSNIQLDDDLLYKQYEKHYNKNKYKKIIYLLIQSIKKPFLLKEILKKVGNLFHLLILRIKGEKVRW